MKIQSNMPTGGADPTQNISQSPPKTNIAGQKEEAAKAISKALKENDFKPQKTSATAGKGHLSKSVSGKSPSEQAVQGFLASGTNEKRLSGTVIKNATVTISKKSTRSRSLTGKISRSFKGMVGKGFESERFFTTIASSTPAKNLKANLSVIGGTIPSIGPKKALETTQTKISSLMGKFTLPKDISLYKSSYKTTQFDAGGAGQVYQTKTGKAYKEMSVADKKTMEDTKKEVKFSNQINDNLEELGLSKTAAPARSAMVYGLNGAVKGMKQKFFSEGGYHKFVQKHWMNKDASPQEVSSMKVNFAKQALEGFMNLSKIRFAHMDIKPQNLLIDHQDGKYALVFGDLGSGINFKDTPKNIAKQILTADLTDSHVFPLDKKAFQDIQGKVKDLIGKKDPDSKQMLGDLIKEAEVLTNKMTNYSMGLTLANIFYTNPMLTKLPPSDEDMDSDPSTWKETVTFVGFGKSDVGDTQTEGASIKYFVDQDAKDETSAKCPKPIRDLILKLTDGTNVLDAVTREKEIEAALASLK